MLRYRATYLAGAVILAATLLFSACEHIENSEVRRQAEDSLETKPQVETAVVVDDIWASFPLEALNRGEVKEGELTVTEAQVMFDLTQESVRASVELPAGLHILAASFSVKEERRCPIK